MQAHLLDIIPLIFWLSLAVAVLAFLSSVALVRFTGGIRSLALALVLMYLAAAAFAAAIVSGGSWWFLA
jgi:hypothetical protein